MAIGIPKLPKIKKESIRLSLLGRAQGKLWQFLADRFRWGVFLPGSNERAVEVDSIIDLSYSNDATVAEYPTQDGFFASYNKLQNAFEAPVRISKGGSVKERRAFLEWLASNLEKTTKFDVVTPEAVYKNVTLASYSYDRSAEAGSGLIIANCTFREIREAPARYFNANTGRANTTNAQDAGARPMTATTRTNATPITGAKDVI